MKPDLDAIRARCEAATPGPWHAAIPTCDHEHELDEDAASIEGPDGCIIEDCVEYEQDIQFIVHARTDIPALLAYIDELEAAWRNERGSFASCNRARQHCELDCQDLRKRVAELEARTTYAAGETEWANRIAHAEARFVEEYDARKAAERQVEELKARIVTLEAMKP